MGYMSIDILCPDCELIWDDLVERDQRDAAQECPACGCTDARRTMSIPNITKVSYHDGYSRGEAYSEYKEIARLKKQRANLPEHERGSINNEIDARATKVRGKKNKSD